MVHVETYERKVTIKQPKFLSIIDNHSERLNRGYYMAARGYEFHLRVVKLPTFSQLKPLKDRSKNMH